MKHNIEYKNFEPQERVNSLIESQIAKAEKKLRNFSPEVLFLRMLIEENKVRTLYQVSMSLEVRGRTLATKEEGHEAEVAIRDAFAEIERQVMEYKSRLRGQHLWNRLTKREEIRKMKVVAEPDEERKREIFFSLVSPHIDRLNHLVLHMIRLSETTGELVKGELNSGDIVDSTLVRGYREFLSGYPSQDVKNWLTRIAMDVLDAEVAFRKRDRETKIHIEESIPETSPAEEVSTLGDEILDFYQPDEDLRFEDILPDVDVPTPEQITETRELRRLLKTLLAQMPGEWRRALLLHDLGGRTKAEVANAIGKREREVGRILERAREYLRQKLMDYGYGVKRAA